MESELEFLKEHGINAEDQNDFEKEIITKADEELNERELEREKKRVLKTKTLINQTLQRINQVKTKLRSSSITENEKKIAQERLNLLKIDLADLKKQEGEIFERIASRLNEDTSRSDVLGMKETEKEKMIRLGLMNPFDKLEDNVNNEKHGEIIIEEESPDEEELDVHYLERSTDELVTSPAKSKGKERLIETDKNLIKDDDNDDDDDEFQLIFPKKKRKLVKLADIEEKSKNDSYIESEEEIQSEYEEEENASQSLDEYEIPLSDDSLTSLPNDAIKRRYLDDGDEGCYKNRIIEWVISRLRKRKVEELDYKKITLEMIQKEMLESDPDIPDYKVSNSNFYIPGEIYSKLFDYQKTCLKWLYALHKQEVGGIIGDEMGLGKTIQVIGFLASLSRSNLLGSLPVLIVCPATVLKQWVKEFHKWYPPFRVAIIHSSGSGMQISADEDEDYEMEMDLDLDKSKKFKDPNAKPLTKIGKRMRQIINRIVEKGHVLVTTYAGLRIHREILLPIKWSYAILDEGHKIRNPDADITITCKQLRTSHRIILSGTPIQNNLTELWSLFDFIFPGRLGTLPVFQEEFSFPISSGGYANATHIEIQTAYKCACILRDLINPYLLRRLKIDVAQQLPKKNEHVLFCKLTDIQINYYKEFLKSRDCNAILNGRKHVLFGIDILRKICNHPDLINFDKWKKKQKYHEQKTKIGSNSMKKKKYGLASSSIDYGSSDEENENEFNLNNNNNEDDDDKFDDDDQEWKSRPDFGQVSKSGKLSLVESLLKFWYEENQKKPNTCNKILLFCQTRQMMNIMEKMVQDCKYSYYRMDGTTPIQKRHVLVDDFNRINSLFLFLLTTKVGGLGINLTGANKIIIFDPDWNPSTDIQARERAWRIGQKKEVTIYRLMTKGTIEEKILQRQIFKHYLTNKILKDPKQKRFFKSQDLQELFRLNLDGDDEVDEDMMGTTETGNLFSETNAEITKAHVTNNRRKNDEDRVLKSIFDFGVHSALKHDVIMNEQHNYSQEKVLVETEADKIAKRAAEELKKSRDQRKGIKIHVPTWTGKHGVAGLPNKRFGNKKNTLLVNNSQSSQNLFNNNLEGNSGGFIGQNSELSSESLLNGIGITPEKNVQNSELINEIRNFIYNNGGRIESEKLVDHFKSKLNNNQDLVIFKKMLKEIANLEKNPENKQKWWVLKHDYM